MLLDALKWQPSFSSLLDLMLFLLLCNPESPQWRWNFTILSTSTRRCVFTQYYCRGCSLQPSVQLTSSPRWGVQIQCTPYLTQASATKMLSFTYSLATHIPCTSIRWPSGHAAMGQVHLAGRFNGNKGNKGRWLQLEQGAKIVFEKDY